MYQALLRQYLTPYRRTLGLLALCLLAGIGFQLAVPQLLSHFIDLSTQGAELTALTQVAVVFWTVALSSYVVNLGRTYLKETLAWGTTNRLRADLAAHCLRLDQHFHRKHAPGELIERVDGDVSTLARFFSELLLVAVTNGLLLLGVLVVMWVEMWQIGLVFTLFAGVTMALLYALRNIATQDFEDSRQTRADLLSFLEERLAGTEDIAANGGGPYTLNRLFATMGRYGRADGQAYNKIIVLRLTMILLFSLGGLLALGLGVYFYRAGTITLGQVYLLYSYMNMLAWPIEQLTLEVQNFQTAAASLRRIETLRQTPVTIVDGPDPLPLQTGPLCFDQVTFGYEPETPILKSLSFELPAGHTLGLLGRTGSGKTTLARLLLRFYDPQAGAIRLGGKDIREVGLADLRQRVALVTQDVQIFNATVRENLSFFDAAVSDAQLLNNLAGLGLQSWFERLPEGLDSRLAADQLSAGEAQLIALARVFLKDPQVVILDEASSRLDPETERLVDGAVRRLLENRTGIIIAHRLATIQQVDAVLVLRDGQIVEQGERVELLAARDSLFSRLLRSAAGDPVSELIQ